MLVNCEGFYGLDFSNDGAIDTGTVLFSGTPVDSDIFYVLAQESGFRINKNLAKSNVLFQVNRPESVTSLFGAQMVDPVSDMPIFMGGNGSFNESFLSLPYVIFDLDKESPHSNYLCQGLTCADAGNLQSYLNSARDKYTNPEILSPP